jgi:hypothetical protein
MVAPALLAAPGRPFPTAILVEGYARDFESWPARLEAAGLQRALFVNSQAANAARGRTAVVALERRSAIQARSVFIGNRGHGFGPKTVEGVRSGLADLLADLPSWQRYPYPPVEPQ